jgi:hypothetical protein
MKCLMRDCDEGMSFSTHFLVKFGAGGGAVCSKYSTDS